MPHTYHHQLEAARRIALALTEAQAREFIRLLEEYADEIAERVRLNLATAGERRVLRELDLVLAEMTQEMARTLGQNVRLTAQRVTEIQAAATAELLSSVGSTLAISASFSSAGLRAAQAILSRPELAEAFVSIRRRSAAAANRIIRRGILRGAPSGAIARELRQYIAMPGSLLEGDASVLADRRRIGYNTVAELGYARTPENLAYVRQEASQIAFRAQRIARTEIMQAEREAFVQGAIESPVVAFVQVRLSYRHTERCACEPIAELDLYGHGPGVYDPRNVPVRPHPHCWCPHSTVLRPQSEWGDERGPVPGLLVDLGNEAEAFGLTPSAQNTFIRAVQTGRREVLEPVGGIR